MLKGISPRLSPELLATLHRMGHGDDIVLADAHFPGHSLGPAVIRADGLSVTDLLQAMLPLFELDSYVAAPLVMMAAVEGDTLDPAVEQEYRAVIEQHTPRPASIARLARGPFYDLAAKAFVIVMTSETRKYGNLVLKKGVTPP
jgi:L-fucose mutarotase